ncbi:MAG: GNAT family N-acetyltransferase [Chryseobacterium sp.]|nr:GNAT family N-acetyltransferase [Chryseobacterium sp.]
MELKRTNSEDLDFINLVKDLDFYLALKDGEEHFYYAQFNKISALQNCLVVFENDEAIGCGAIKSFGENVAEVKRMYVKPEFRNKGFATIILTELEQWAKELKFKKTILETGKRQTEAVNLYAKTYSIIPNYGQYAGIENSICFEKDLIS